MKKLQNILMMLLSISLLVSIVLFFVFLSSPIWTDNTETHLYCLQIFLKSMFYSTIPMYIIVRILD
jgi:hypothetical protein